MKTVKGFRLNKYSYKTSTVREKTQTNTHSQVLTNITKTYTTLHTYTHRNTPT